MAGNAISVDYWPASKIKHYDKKLRKRDDAIEPARARIQRYGFRAPLLISGAGVIIDGATDYDAGVKLGMDSFPVIVCDGLSEEEVRGLRLSIARGREHETWDKGILALEMSELQGLSFDLADTGFNTSEITGLLAKVSGNTDPDATPATPSNPVTVAGDVWLLGDHRIICGDSTDPAVVSALLGKLKPLLMVTDPPYGDDYDPTWRQTREAPGLHGGGRGGEKLANDTRADWREAYVLFPGEVAYVWHSDKGAPAFGLDLDAAGFETRAQIVWVKQRPVIGRGNYNFQHEACWYAVRKKATANWKGGGGQSTVWNIEHVESETGHPTQKPVECMKRGIENNSSPGQLVYDPFLGSGTTIIAAQMTGRVALGVELSPAYVDVAVLRWQEFTGQVATLVAAQEGESPSLINKTFVEVMAARQPQTPLVPAKSPPAVKKKPSRKRQEATQSARP